MPPQLETMYQALSEEDQLLVFEYVQKLLSEKIA